MLTKNRKRRGGMVNIVLKKAREFGGGSDAALSAPLAIQRAD
jgi:hypothetical protein